MTADPFHIPITGDRIPRSVTMLNAMLSAARESSDADSRPLSDELFSTENYPFRIIWIRNSGPLQIWNDQPVPIGKPASLAEGDFINGQPVFPTVSYERGWATYARPLKRLPPGCAGPAVILGWLGPQKIASSGVLGGTVWRRTQPQRCYGGTALTGVPYIQATAQNFPRSETTWNGVGWKAGFANYPGIPERVPQMESLKNYLHWSQGVFLQYAHKVDMHGWWCPVLEIRRQQFGALGNGQTYYFPPTDRRVRICDPLEFGGGGATFSGNVDVYYDPILWNPAVVSFNPAYGANNFNRDPIVSPTGTFNPSGGLIPQEMLCLQTAPVNWSTKGHWNADQSENFRMCNSPNIYGFTSYIDIDQGTWTPGGYWPQTWRYAIGPEVLHLFETDRDDASDASGTVIQPGIGTGSGSGPMSSDSGKIGPEIIGPISGGSVARPMRSSVSPLVQPITGSTYGSVLGSGGASAASSTLSGSGTATGSGIG
jgi:hypothetical protein